nr:DUF805 domain-containing protein [Sinomonas susongensis]
MWAPYYGAPFRDAVQRFFKKYATFSGRASRAEYWWWTLAGSLVGLLMEIFVFAGMTYTRSTYHGQSYVTPTLGPVAIIAYILVLIWALAILVPTLALTVRRLHDVNMSGWMYLIALVPFVGGFVVLAFTLLPPHPAGQRFDVPTYAARGF